MSSFTKVQNLQFQSEEFFVPKEICNGKSTNIHVILLISMVIGV